MRWEDVTNLSLRLCIFHQAHHFYPVIITHYLSILPLVWVIYDHITWISWVWWILPLIKAPILIIFYRQNIAKSPNCHRKPFICEAVKSFKINFMLQVAHREAVNYRTGDSDGTWKTTDESLSVNNLWEYLSMS